MKNEMTITSFYRGNPIEFDIDLQCWVYSNDRVKIHSVERPCPRCGCMPTPEGYDACLGHIEGATSACCGHGIEEGYIIMEDEK